MAVMCMRGADQGGLNVNLYKFGYTIGDQTKYWELSHDTAFAYADFSTMVLSAATAVAGKAREGDYVPPFALLINRIADWLVEHEGFRKVEYTGVWHCDGRWRIGEEDENTGRSEDKGNVDIDADSAASQQVLA